MPELPEVETIKRDLEKKIIGHTIREAAISVPKMVSPKDLPKRLKGFRVLGVSRRAKLLILEGKSDFLLFHLKMTGQIVLRPAQDFSIKDGEARQRRQQKQIIFGGHPIIGLKELPNKYTRAIFCFTNGDILYFNDLRKFGYIKLVSKTEGEKIFGKYGVEPLEKSFTLEHFIELIKKAKTARLKPFLLNQEKISGLGNIYVDEACFLAGVRPMRKANTLTRREQEKLWRAIKTILALSIKHRGTSFNTYIDADGLTGRFWKYRKIYGRRGELCLVCKTPIVYTKLVGRGTHYCPKCQK
ncbi:MAG: bifunctional DNA-formamidopyrimidine glycosylase/DNA-(apurinic or apyrimidinic site) lyase [Patescibacteria group bacterium]